MSPYMRRALALARRALGTTSPNPAVGAVIVKEGRIVGEGFTQPPGQAHAEIMALRAAGEEARGAIMYVTLEPCCHWGRTPPCTQAIISAGIAEVHMAMIDPNPLVSGKGREELERAGIRTYVGEGEEEAREINEAYIKYIQTKLPFVIAKFAMSLDGKIATRIGDSRWITNERARRFVHKIRGIVDAVMVGVDTVLADDPELTPRAGKVRRYPLRVIADSHARTPPSAKIFKVPGRTLIATLDGADWDRKEKLRASGAEILELPEMEGRVDLRELLKALGEREVTSLLVEGGGTLLGSFFDLGLVDKVLGFIAPIIVGGKEAPGPVLGRGVERISEALRLERVRMRRFGDNILISGYVR